MLVPATAEDLKKYADITILKNNGVEGENNGSAAADGGGDGKCQKNVIIKMKLQFFSPLL